jgi:hypothetical protein
LKCCPVLFLQSFLFEMLQHYTHICIVWPIDSDMLWHCMLVPDQMLKCLRNVVITFLVAFAFIWGSDNCEFSIDCFVVSGIVMKHP